MKDIGNVHTSIMCFVLKKILGMRLTCRNPGNFSSSEKVIGHIFPLAGVWLMFPFAKSGKTTFPSVAPSKICYFKSWCTRKSRRISHFPILQPQLQREASGADAAGCHTFRVQLPALLCAASPRPCPASSAKHPLSP